MNNKQEQELKTTPEEKKQFLSSKNAKYVGATLGGVVLGGIAGVIAAEDYPNKVDESIATTNAYNPADVQSDTQSAAKPVIKKPAAQKPKPVEAEKPMNVENTTTCTANEPINLENEAVSPDNKPVETDANPAPTICNLENGIVRIDNEPIETDVNPTAADSVEITMPQELQEGIATAISDGSGTAPDAKPESDISQEPANPVIQETFMPLRDINQSACNFTVEVPDNAGYLTAI